MKFTLERVTQPELEVVTLAEMKRHLRTFSAVTDDDPDITALIVGAREWAEDYSGRALIDQTWRLTIGEHVAAFANVDSDTVRGVYPDPIRIAYGSYCGTWIPRTDGLLLRKSPVIAIVSFKSVSADGVETAVDPATYQLREADSKWPRIVGVNGAWTSGDVRIVFRAGFADRDISPAEGAEVVPVRFKQAIKLHVEAMYDRDEKMMPILIKTAEDLIKPERADLQVA